VRTESQIKSPSKIWDLIDEDEYGIDDSIFNVNMSDTSNDLWDMPSNRHGINYIIGFTDGHTETIKTTAPRSEWNSPGNLDWIRIKEMTTVRRE